MANNNDVSVAKGSDNTFGNGQSTTQGSYNNSAGPISPNDPSGARLAASGLNAGATSQAAQMAGSAPSVTVSSASTVFKPEDDWRIRISVQPSIATQFYYGSANNALLLPLRETNGVVFPYTPQIQVTHTARYNSQTLTHSNYASYFYEGSEVQSISISGEFTVQNILEGQYLMAAIHFFRSITKMFFGSGEFVGAPPPLVFLNGYGAMYFPNVSCVVTQFSHTMPNDNDYVEIPIGQSMNNYAGNRINATNSLSVRLPTTSTLSIQLQPVYSRQSLAKNWSMKNFARGGVYNQAGNTGTLTGGFI